jgi:hypothetical protein
MRGWLRRPVPFLAPRDVLLLLEGILAPSILESSAKDVREFLLPYPPARVVVILPWPVECTCRLNRVSARSHLEKSGHECIEGVAGLFPFQFFLLAGFGAAVGQLVVLAWWSAAGAGLPGSFNPAGFDQSVQCRVEAAFFEFECATRAAVDFFDDLEAVQCARFQRGEQHEVKVDAFWVHVGHCIALQVSCQAR